MAVPWRSPFCSPFLPSSVFLANSEETDWTKCQPSLQRRSFSLFLSRRFELAVEPRGAGCSVELGTTKQQTYYHSAIRPRIDPVGEQGIKQGYTRFNCPPCVDGGTSKLYIKHEGQIDVLYSYGTQQGNAPSTNIPASDLLLECLGFIPPQGGAGLDAPIIIRGAF